MPSLSVEVMLCITVRFLAGARFLDIFQSYNAARSTCFEILTECLRVLNKVRDFQLVKMNSEYEFLSASETYVRARSVLPIKGVISSLD